MRKRLVITGLPCPAQTWEKLLGESEEQRIITAREILTHTKGTDPRALSRYLTDVMEEERPGSILCHGLGVPLTLLALMRLKRRGVELDSKLTIFNGGFRHVPLSKVRHPLRMQWTSLRKILHEVRRNGGEVDMGLMPFAARIRGVFRALILNRLAEKMTLSLGLEFLDSFPKRAGLSMPVQIIASPNDPYLPFEYMEKLRDDLLPERFISLPYGHFPYSAPAETVRRYVQSFE